MADFVRVAALEALPPGKLLGVEVGAERICLARVDDEIFAVQDGCTHQAYTLSSGALDGHTVECAWHGARFDLRTGRAMSLPAVKALRTFAVKLDGDAIHVAV